MLLYYSAETVLLQWRGLKEGRQRDAVSSLCKEKLMYSATSEGTASHLHLLNSVREKHQELYKEHKLQVTGKSQYSVEAINDEIGMSD